MSSPLSETALFEDSNLQGYWKFDSGADTADSSNNSNTLTHVNTPSNGAGQFGNAETYLATSSEYSYKTSPTGFGGTGSFTITGWVKNTAAKAAFSSILSIDVLSSRGFKVGIQGGGVNPAPQLIIFGLTGGSKVHSTNLTDGVWQFVAFRFNSSTNELAVWLGSSKETTTATGTRNNTDGIKLGIGADFTASSDNPANYLNAGVDDLAFFDRVLTDDEITEIRTGASLSPSLSPSASESPSPSVSESLSISPSPSSSESLSPSVSVSLSPSLSLSSSDSPSPSVSESLSMSLSPSLSPSASESASQSPSSSESLSPSLSPSLSGSVSESASPSLSISLSPSASQSPSSSDSPSPSLSESVSESPSPSISESLSPSLSPSVSVSLSPSASQSPSSSESLSPSLSPSLSISLSPSASGSPSSSDSPSPSVSESLSPSVSESQSPSVSESLSLSPSPSLSDSPSPSVSESLSPSLSISLSPSTSVSPSQPLGSGLYSYESLDVLPTDKDDLNILYGELDEEYVSSYNGVYVPNVGSNLYLAHQFRVVNNTPRDQIKVLINLRSSYAPVSSPVYLQVWNVSTSSWETLTSNTSAAMDEDFDLTYTIESNVADYYDDDYEVAFRVYQYNV